MAAPTKVPQSLPGLRKKVKRITAAYSVDVAECGFVFMVSDGAEGAGSGYTVTLPTMANAGAGWNCKIVNNAPAAGSLNNSADEDVRITTGDGNNAIAFVGHHGTTIAAVSDLAAEFIDLQDDSVRGSYVEIWTDGKFWYANGAAAVANALETA